MYYFNIHSPIYIGMERFGMISLKSRTGVRQKKVHQNFGGVSLLLPVSTCLQTIQSAGTRRFFPEQGSQHLRNLKKFLLSNIATPALDIR